jgi:hypothetical protein
MSSNIKLNNLIKALRINVRNNMKDIEKVVKFDINKFIKKGQVDMYVDSDKSIVAEMDDLVQVDLSMATQTMSELERFTGVSINVLRKEEEVEMTEDQWSACCKLRDLETSSKDKAKKAAYHANRASIIDSVEEDAFELDMELAQQGDNRSEDEAIYDSLEATFWKTQHSRGHKFIMWLRENAKDLTRDQLIDWSKKLNKRRFTNSDNKLAYDLWVAGKIVIEKYLSIKGITTKEKAKAAEEFAKRLKEWEDNDLGSRFAKHNEESLADWQMDTENPLAGRASLNYKKFEEYCDMSNTFGDRHVAMGFMLSNENGYEIKEGTNLLSDIVMALVRCEGNKSAAACMCGLPRSTYRGRLNKALKVINDRLDSGVISLAEHKLVVELL